MFLNDFDNAGTGVLHHAVSEKKNRLAKQRRRLCAG
jgi:hypothetical protein